MNIAEAVEAKSRCLRVTLDSNGPLEQPSEDVSAKYKVNYVNECNEDIPQVDIGLVERDNYSGFRYFTTGGKIGRVLSRAKAEITLTLTYDSFIEMRSTIYLLGNAQFPLQSKTESALTSVTFSQTKKSPTPTASQSEKSAPSPSPSPTKVGPSFSSTPSKSPIPVPTPSKVKTSSSPKNSIIGKSCLKNNSKKWEKDVPIVCKKNSKGKLVWQLFSQSSSGKNEYVMRIFLTELNETLLSSNSNAAWYCDQSGGNYKDINASTVVQIRDASDKIIASKALGNASVVDVEGQPLGSCVFEPTLLIPKSDFYQLKIGSRFENVYSFSDLVSMNWQLTLYIGDIK